MLNEFYVINEKYTGYAEAIRDENQMIVKKCSICGSIFSNRKNDKFRVHFQGKREGDYYYAPICNIVSQKFLSLLKSENITGFIEKDIECSGWYDTLGNILQIDFSKYKELEVTGKAGYLKNINGKQVIKCIKCNSVDWKHLHEVNGLLVDLSWDRSDLFYFENWQGVIITTKKVKELVEKNKLKNIEFEKLSEFKF